MEVSINAKRLAAFADGNDGVTVEYVADDAALNALKQRYGNPVALISGDYESKTARTLPLPAGGAALALCDGDMGEMAVSSSFTRTEQSPTVA